MNFTSFKLKFNSYYMNRRKQESCECKESLVMYKSDWDGQCYCKLYNFGGQGVYCWLCHICVGILGLIVFGAVGFLVLGTVFYLNNQSDNINQLF